MRVVIAAVVALLVASLPAAGADSLTPASTTLTLVRGGSQTIEKVLHLDALPQKADVVIAVDTTGSMGGAIADAKADATAIVNGVRDLIPQARFAVVDFQDYPVSPFGSAGDVPYELRQPLTATASEVQAAIDAMTLGDGGDFPESHNRVFYEAYSDSALLYDPQATRILIVLTDAIPHDKEQASTYPACANTPNDDPGRDGSEATAADNLKTAATIAGLRANNTTLSVVTYTATTSVADCLKALAEATGGSQVPRGGTGSLLTLIQNLVTQQAQRIDQITFRVTPATHASWLTFDPPTPYGPYTAPRDIPFEETITVPEGAAIGNHTITVTALVDGAERATQTLEVNVAEQAIGGLSVEVDRRSVQAGIASFPPSVVPAGRIPFFGGASVASTPVGSVPVGSVPVGSIPVGSIPVGSVPVGSIPVGSVPVGSIGLLSIPVGSVPVGSVPVGIPVGSVPVGSVGLDRILLSSVPLDPGSGTSWAAILAGTPLAARPLQTLTLLDVAKDATAGVRFNALRLKDVPFFSSLLRSVKLASVLLGTATLSQVPAPGAAGSWTALLNGSGGSSAGVDTATNTVLGLDLAGRLGTTPVGSIPVGSVPVGSVPVGSIPVGSIDLRRTRLASVLVSVLVGNLASVVDCAAGFCTATRTLGEAQTAGRILASARIAHVDPALKATGITLAELIAAMIGLENYPWQQVPLVGLQDVAGTGERARYTVELDLACSLLAQTLSGVRLTLPSGFVPVSGSPRWTFGTASPVAGPDATEERLGFKWAPPASVCAGSTLTRHVKFEVDTFAGLDLGDFTTSATVTASAGASLSVSGQAPVLVVQNHEANDAPASATTIVKNRVYAFHVAAAGDKEVFSLPIPARNTRTKISLHVPDGADLDLVVGKPESAALNSAPVGSVPVGSVPVGSVPLPDEGATANDAARSPQPDTLQDIPVGSVPVGSVSANRGSVDEASQIVSQGESGLYTVVVSGYNGSHSPQPATLYVTETPPPPLPACQPRRLGLSSVFGTLPVSLPAGTKTLFLVNRNQMARLHGEVAVQTLLDYIGTTVAGRSEVAGAVLQIDGAAAVRNAYATWNATPCSVEAANAAVRAANDVVGSYLAALPNLKHVVLLGSDEVVPSGRVPDPVLISPELDNASDLAFTTAGLTNGNALYAAAATNHILTDAVYGAFTTIPWLGRRLNLPQVAVSRLLESPAEIGGQLLQYVTANGLLAPTTAYVTGYDFLTDGAEDVSDGLTRPGRLASTLQTSPNWDTKNVSDEFFAKSGGAPDIGSINAHYNHYLAQPAAAASAADLFSTSIVPSLPGRILFTMGCHAGLNVADSLLTGTLPPDALDWAQRYAQAQVAVYVANYTYGYGDTEAAALSERLMALFATRAGADDRTLAEQWVESLHTYFTTAGTAYGVYDEKVLIGANLMGPPWYRVSGAPPATTPAITPPTITVAPTTTMVGPGSGGGPTYWRGESVLSTHYRPIQPVSSVRISPPAGTPPARGIFITALTTHDVTNVIPVLAYPTIDLGAHEPKANFDETFFPANYVLLSRTGAQTRAVVAAGQFRPTPGSDRGTQRLVDSITFDVAFDADEAPPPQISEVGAVATATGIRVFVRAADASGIRRAAVLINDGLAAWQFVPLTSQGGGLFTADVTGATMDAEILAEVENVHGYTGYSTKKGENFNPIVDTGGPEILVEVPKPDAVYVLGEVVAPNFACSDAGGVVSCSAPPVDTSTVGTKTFTVTATDVSGNTATVSRAYTVVYRDILFSSSRTGFGDVYAISSEVATAAPRQVTSGPAIDAEPDWFPGEQRFTFTRVVGGNVEIFAMDMDGTDLVRLTNNSAIDTSPAVSPDGKKIAFASNRGGNWDVYVMDALDGANIKRLTTNSAVDTLPAWRPNGLEIAFSSGRTGNGDIYTMKADGTSQTQLTSGTSAGRIDTEPTWFGAKIAFSSNRGASFDIYTIPAGGGAATRLTTQAGHDFTPSASRDGARILFASNRPGGTLNFDVYAMNADGTNQTALVVHPAIDAFPEW